MSFGKNSQVRAAVGSFRQMSNQFTKNNYGKRKGGGGLPYFVDMFQPPINELCTVRLVPGEYLQDQIIEVPAPTATDPNATDVTAIQVISPFIKFVDHFDGSKQRGAICSAGAFANFKDKRQPCHGCDIYWATVVRNPNGRLESSRMSRQNKYAFSVFDYSPYHKLEQYDQETGQVKVNSKGEPYYNWVRCGGQGCDGCRAQKETKMGHMSHWPINYTQLQVLRSAEADIGHSCAVCCQENCIISLGWMCGSCGEGVVDMSTTELKRDELLKLTDEPYVCGACHNKEFLKEVYECRSCTPRGQTGVRASLFDVDLKVKLVPGGQNNSKVLQVSGWSAPHGIAPELAEVVKPVDLVARYAPMPLEKQADLFGVVPTMQTPTSQQQQPRAPQTSGFQNAGFQAGGHYQNAGQPPAGPQGMATGQAAARPYTNPYANRG